jgi:hypothetical protein
MFASACSTRNKSRAFGRAFGRSDHLSFARIPGATPMDAALEISYHRTPTPLGEVPTMTVEGELRVFLRRSTEGTYRLESEDGRLVLQGRSYRELRDDLRTLLGTSRLPPRVKILLGSPRPQSAPPLEHGAIAELRA